MVSVVIHSEASSQSIKDWESFIMNDKGESSDNTPQQDKIYEVPQILRQNESTKKCYEPKVVSIGPYHHGKQELTSGEKFKILLTRKYVESCKQQSVASLYKQVERVAVAAQKCYSEQSTKRFSDDAFIKMMVLDGCFILQFVLCFGDGKCNQMNMKSHDIAFIRRDLFLLENQLPFQVLNVLMSCRVEFDEGEGLRKINKFIDDIRTFQTAEDSWFECVKNLFQKYIFCPKRSEEEKAPPPPVHLLQLMWRQLIDIQSYQDLSKGGEEEGENDKKGKSRRNAECYTYRSAQDLKTAGIHFRPSKSARFTDVRYEPGTCRGILRLPKMVIDDFSESLFLNLVAYEMCPNSPKELGVISYLWFIDTLIDYPQDVKELRQKGIILNFLGNDQQVADLFNKIANDLVPDPDAYKTVRRQIEQHYQSKFKLWITEWVHIHFSSPWTILAFLGAILALFLSCDWVDNNARKRQDEPFIHCTEKIEWEMNLLFWHPKQNKYDIDMADSQVEPYSSQPLDDTTFTHDEDISWIRQGVDGKTTNPTIILDDDDDIDEIDDC
ncbi:hypothetical protein F0562_015492 [Nyssa sinensis]|uniref:Uncharacterized protein n=1 Tax=Nyssa sinensis TaxID=561372 RepID=A0A5J4ZL86_9ASTE|nr:hypothetical protein F0562_015492 [Nyssa sinensis]